MTRRPWIRFALTGSMIVGVAASGCNGDTQLPTVDGGAGDRPGTTSGNDGGKRDARVNPDLPAFEALPDRPPPPPPTPEPPTLVPGRARLVGPHFTACSNASPGSANGDRWCAFTMPNKQ